MIETTPEQPCICQCHLEDSYIIHFMPCCDGKFVFTKRAELEVYLHAHPTQTAQQKEDKE